MQRALVSGVAIAVLCSVVGMFLVLRRYSLFGDAMAHSSFGGIAFGLMAGIYPIWAAYIVAIASALTITKVRERFDISGDAAVAILLSSGIAIGLVIIGLQGGFSIDIFSFLFGSILLVGINDALMVLPLVGIILITMLVFRRQLLYSTFNEEQAKASGINVKYLNYLLIFIAGITVVTSIQLIGVLLISSLFVIPNVTAIIYGRGFKQTVLISITYSVSSVVVGIILSYIFNIAPAGTIVLLSLGLLAGTLVAKATGLLRRDYSTKSKTVLHKNH